MRKTWAFWTLHGPEINGYMKEMDEFQLESVLKTAKQSEAELLIANATYMSTQQYGLLLHGGIRLADLSETVWTLIWAAVGFGILFVIVWIMILLQICLPMSTEPPVQAL